MSTAVTTAHTLPQRSYLQDARMPMGRDGGRGESEGVKKKFLSLHSPRKKKEEEGWRVKSRVVEEESDQR